MRLGVQKAQDFDHLALREWMARSIPYAGLPDRAGGQYHRHVAAVQLHPAELFRFHMPCQPLE
jgi:hypothetical protein